MKRVALALALLVLARSDVASADSIPMKTNLDMGTHKVVNLTQATATTDAVAGGRTITAGTGLSGGGNLTADRTLNLSNVGLGTGSCTLCSISVNDQGQVTTYSSSSSALSGSGAAGRLTLWSGSSTVTSDAGLLWSTTGPTVTLSGSAPVLKMTDTTSSAKSLLVTTDGNATKFEEQGGAAANLLVLNLADALVGIGGAATNPQIKLDVFGNNAATFAGRISNLDGGTGSISTWAAENDVGDGVAMSMYSSVYTLTYGFDHQDGAALYTSGTGGLSVGAINAAGALRFFAGSNSVVRGQIDTSGNLFNYGVTTVSLATAALPTAATGTILRVGAADSASAYVATESFAADGGVVFRRANGTEASPTGIATNDTIGGIYAEPRGSSVYASAPRAAVELKSSQDTTDSHQGTYVSVHTTPTDSVTMREIARFDQSGYLKLGVASSVTGVLEFESAANSFTTSLKAGTPTASVAYVLPTADATAAAQVLASDGSGTLSWIDVSSGHGFGGSAVTSLNGLVGTLSIAAGTSGTDFAVSPSGSTITLNLPSASASARGVVTTGTQTIAGAKTFSSTIASGVASTATGGVSLAHASSSHLTTIAPGNATADWTLTLPTGAPVTAGSVLTSSDTAGTGAWVATLPLGNGGTGQTTRTAAFDGLAPASPATGDILYYNGSHWVDLAIGTSSQALLGGATPSWGTIAGGGTGTVGWAQAECNTLILNAGMTNATATCIVEEFDDTTNSGFGNKYNNGGTVHANTGAGSVIDGIGLQVTSGATGSSTHAINHVTTVPDTMSASAAAWGISCYARLTTAVNTNTEWFVGGVNASVSFSDDIRMGFAGTGVRASGNDSNFILSIRASSGTRSDVDTGIGVDNGTWHTFREWYTGSATKGNVDAGAVKTLTTNNPAAAWGFIMYIANNGTATTRTGQVDACVFAKPKGS